MGSKKQSKTKRNRHISPALTERPLERSPEGVPVQATGDQLLGRYCNVAVITHTDREFVLDFFWRLDSVLILASRVITNPQHVKQIYRVLGQNIEKYEKKYGEIALDAKLKT